MPEDKDEPYIVDIKTRTIGPYCNFQKIQNESSNNKKEESQDEGKQKF